MGNHPVLFEGEMVSTLVLGLGNTIMSDDGVGPHVIELLRKERLPDHVSLMDGGTLGLDLLPYLEGIRRLVIVDAVETGQPAGTVIQLVGDQVPIALETKLSPHQMGMKDLLAVARLMGQMPDEIILIGIQPGCLEMGTELTLPVALSLPRLCSMALHAACQSSL